MTSNAEKSLSGAGCSFGQLKGLQSKENFHTFSKGTQPEKGVKSWTEEELVAQKLKCPGESTISAKNTGQSELTFR